MTSLVLIPGQGNLSIAPSASAPLLVVFGGIDAHQLHGSVYMWNYMNPLTQRFHIFVALTNHLSGTLAFGALMKAVTANGLKPSKQVLYLFSGGYKPGIDLLRGGTSQFDAIYLVDIWLGGAMVGDFYKSLADHDALKMTYVYTIFAANNKVARDYIANKVAPRATLINSLPHEGGVATHMRTNVTAVSTL